MGQHVRRARERLGIDLAKTSERLTKVGWPITKSALSRLENGQRRVDVDDLMALAVALCVSPIDLLLGESEVVVPPTAVPEVLAGDEIRAWAAGEVELDRGEIILWWQNEITLAQSQLESLRTLRDTPPTHGAKDRARRLDSEIRWVQGRIQEAVGRIAVLSGDIAGVKFDDLPPDPTVEIRFGN